MKCKSNHTIYNEMFVFQSAKNYKFIQFGWAIKSCLVQCTVQCAMEHRIKQINMILAVKPIFTDNIF